MTHGMLPESMLSVTLVPVVKDKAGKVGSLDNYRPIALASVLSKAVIPNPRSADRWRSVNTLEFFFP